MCVSIYTASFGDHWNDGGLAWYNELTYGTRQLTKDLISPNVDYSMLFIDDIPVAYMKLKFSSSIGGAKRDETFELQKLYVVPGHKGKGLGGQLMNRALLKAKDLGKKSIRLEALETNAAAVRFYEKFGFSVLMRTRLDVPYFKDDRRGLLIMELVLQKNSILE